MKGYMTRKIGIREEDERAREKREGGEKDRKKLRK